MARGFRLLPAGLEESQFKRVPEGWLFTTVNPRVFGPRRTYLVSDAQKPAIARRVRRGRYIRMFMMVPAVLLLAAAFRMMPSLMNLRSVMAWLVLGTFVIALTIAIGISDNLAVRSLLRDLPRSSQKVGLADMLRRQTEAMSVKALSIFVFIFVVAGVANTYQALVSVNGNAFAAIGAVSFILFAIPFAGMLIAKLRAR